MPNYYTYTHHQLNKAFTKQQLTVHELDYRNKQKDIVRNG